MFLNEKICLPFQSIRNDIREAMSCSKNMFAAKENKFLDNVFSIVLRFKKEFSPSDKTAPTLVNPFIERLESPQ